MDISHLSFLRQFRGISERVSGGGASFELPGIGVSCRGRSVSLRSRGLS